MRIALYQPDIPQNAGNIFRLGACLGVSVDIIEPTGFIFDDKKFKRSAMDYIDHIDYQRHVDWEHFYECYQGLRHFLFQIREYLMSEIEIYRSFD